MLAGEKKEIDNEWDLIFIFNKSEVMRWKVNQCVTHTIKIKNKKQLHFVLIFLNSESGGV